MTSKVKTSKVQMADPNASCSLRINRNFVFISHQLGMGSSIPGHDLDG